MTLVRVGGEERGVGTSRCLDGRRWQGQETHPPTAFGGVEVNLKQNDHPSALLEDS